MRPLRRAVPALLLLASGMASAQQPPGGDRPEDRCASLVTDEAPTEASLRACLDALAVAGGAGGGSRFSGSIAQAELAIERAAALDPAGEREAAARARRIARAALLLADRELALERARRGAGGSP